MLCIRFFFTCDLFDLTEDYHQFVWPKHSIQFYLIVSVHPFYFIIITLQMTGFKNHYAIFSMKENTILIEIFQ